MLISRKQDTPASWRPSWRSLTTRFEPALPLPDVLDFPDPETLCTYILVRRDLCMPPGKLAAQAAHAAAQSLIHCLTLHPHWIPCLQALQHSGTRVVLHAPDEAALRGVLAHARFLGLPAALFEDSGHILPPHFTGAPTVTALGIGPAPRALLRPLVKKFSCA